MRVRRITAIVEGKTSYDPRCDPPPLVTVEEIEVPDPVLDASERSLLERCLGAYVPLENPVHLEALTMLQRRGLVEFGEQVVTWSWGISKGRIASITEEGRKELSRAD